MSELHENFLEELYQEEIYDISTRTVVVIPDAWSTVDNAERELLSKILAAVKVGLSGARIISEAKITHSRLKQLSPEHVLVLGSAVHPRVEPYRVHRMDDFKLVAADPLKSLDEPRKKLFWAALKEMYAL